MLSNLPEGTPQRDIDSHFGNECPMCGREYQDEWEDFYDGLCPCEYEMQRRTEDYEGA